MQAAARLHDVVADSIVNAVSEFRELRRRTGLSQREFALLLGTLSSRVEPGILDVEPSGGQFFWAHIARLHASNGRDVAHGKSGDYGSW